MRKLLVLFIFLFFPFVVFSQEGGMHSYYSTVNWNQSSAALKSTLNSLISSGHTNLPYTSGSEDTWDVLQISDLISGSNNVSLIYGYEDGSDAEPKNDISRDKSLMSSGTCTGYWNREHIFPKSLATPALDTDSAGSGTDLHNLRAADCQMNSTRNNNVYGDGSGDSVLNSGVFFPGDGTGTGGDDYRGDVARAIMYMYVRYPSQINPNNVASSNNTYHDDMPDIFLEWNQADPPSPIEILRNDTFHTKQLNRNPFIDNPYIAELIWGGPSVTAWWDLAAPRISFSSNSSSVSETNGDVSTNISISMYNYDAAVSISVLVNGSSTAENGDYTLNTSSLTFNSNGSQNISVTTKNDDDNHDETIILDVSITSDAADPETATLTIRQHTISITDDEKELIITEIADPDNSSSSRFVEIYNSSNKSVDLSTYYLLRWTNGNSNPQNSKISLSSECGSTLAANTFCIISNDTNSGTNFATMYGFEPDGKSGTGGAVDSNGDDNIAIITIASGVTYSASDASTYTVIDMFGVAGTDGTNQDHEFEDGRAERKASLTIPSATWGSGSWNVDNDGGDGEGAQDAPQGFDPGYWIGATDVDTWTGRSSASWANLGNWSSGVVPASGDKVFIHDANNDPDISTDIPITDLTVKANGVLDIEATGSLSLSGNFSNSGTVTLNSTSSVYSSIKVGGTSSGNITYNRYVNSLGGGTGWDLIGSPVNGLQISSFATTNDSPLATGNGSGAGDVGEYAIGTYDPSNNTWTNYTTSNVSTTQFTPGKGYQMATDSGATMAFTGTIDTDATETISVESFTDASGRRWNLISNPYPSYITISPSSTTNTFLEVNDDVIDDTYEGVYGYDAVADPSTYTILNNLSSGSIAPGQGFFVAARSTTAANITFKEEMQTVNGSDDFISGDVFQHAEVELRLFNNDNLMGKTNLFFVENLTLGLDPGYDAGSFTQNDPLMTRLVENDEGHGMAINAMGLDAMENVVVPLVINQIAGQELRVNLHNANVNGANVFLEDSLEGLMIDLKADDFTLTPTSDLEGVGRFFIHITADTMSSGEASTSLLNAYKKVDSSYITVEGLATQPNETKVHLYNILGTGVLSTTLYNNINTQEISTVGLSAGIYIIELESGNNRLSKKLIIQ
jgi:endonuclease I